MTIIGGGARIQSRAVGDALPKHELDAAGRPEQVANQTFDVTRRGFNQQHVRDYLAAVADALGDAQRREAEMRTRLGKAVRRAEAAEATLRDVSEREPADVETLTRELGDHVAGVIEAARSAGDDTIAAAKQAADQIIAEAETEAAEIRSSAEELRASKTAAANAEAADLLAQAEAAADATRDQAQDASDELRRQAIADVERAKSECDTLIAEAEEARSQVLADLERRRREARAQVERLRVGRDRLLRAYEIVRRNLDESTVELRSSLKEAKVLGDTAARAITAEPLRDARQLEDELADAKLLRSTPPRSPEPSRPSGQRRVGSGPRVPIAKAKPDLDSDFEGAGDGDVQGELGDAGGSPEQNEKTAPTPKRPRIGAPSARKPRRGPRPQGAALPTNRVMRTGEAAALRTDQADESLVGSTPAERPPVHARRHDADFSALPEGELAVVEPSDEIEQVVLLVDGLPVSEEAQGSTATADAASVADAAEVADSAADAAADADDDERSAGLFAALRSETDVDAAEADASDMVADTADVDATEVDTADVDVDVELDATSAVAAEVASLAPRVEALCAQRDAIATELRTEMHKRLKRALADEQNEVLAGIRSANCLIDLVGDPDRHLNHYVVAMTDIAALAYGAGVALIDDDAEPGVAPAGAVEEIVTNDIIVPLRLRLIELDATEADSPMAHVDAIRAFYRGRKTEPLVEAATKITTLLVNAGACDALPEGSMAPWVAAPTVA